MYVCMYVENVWVIAIGFEAHQAAGSHVSWAPANSSATFWDFSLEMRSGFTWHWGFSMEIHPGQWGDYLE